MAYFGGKAAITREEDNEDASVRIRLHKPEQE
jgi:hypothetical protein